MPEFGPLKGKYTLKKLAHAAHPDMSEEEAEKKWVNKTGKRLRENKVL